MNDKDLRKACYGRDPQSESSQIMLLFISDLNKFGGNSPFARTMAPLDAGSVSQNICLMFTEFNLNTVSRMTMDYEMLKAELGLDNLQLPLLNHPISKP